MFGKKNKMSSYYRKGSFQLLALNSCDKYVTSHSIESRVNETRYQILQIYLKDKKLIQIC